MAVTPSTPAGIDLDRLRQYLDRIRPDLAHDAASATLIAGGRSNLTYRVGTRSSGYVLRRPPLGHVLSTAHDMAREFRVISALADTPVPVPAPILYCPDAEVIGAPFYLMQYVPGTVYRSRGQTAPLGPAGRRQLAESMMDVLAALHRVVPADAGLADFGYPRGFLARQLRRWSTQLDHSRSRRLPGIDALRDALAAGMPEPSSRVALLHGDYRLDNLMVTGGDPDSGPGPRIAAVLDWEMATLGDPLTDLGLLLTYWDALGDMPAAGNPMTDIPGPAAGFPTGTELIDRYAKATGTDVPDLAWYVALGCFKLAVICEGIHYRYTLGQTLGDGFDKFGDLVQPLVRHGLAVLGANPSPA